MKYSDFLHPGYVPKGGELICLFKIEPKKGFSMREAASRVASESSNGTWSDLSPPEHIKALSAKCFEVGQKSTKIAYPPELFEGGNMPQILSSIAGNIFGMKAVSNLRLEDITWPEEILKSFKGPQFGIHGVKKFLKIKDRPVLATVPKPKVGFYSEEHAKVGYEAWSGGVDLLKDDENLSSQTFNRFEKRLELSMKMRDKAEKETGERKSYLVNITAETEEMKRRAKLVKDHGNEFAMVDILTAGWAGVQTIRDTCQELGLAIHAHRAFHAAFDRNPKHGMSMKVIAEISRIVGVDQLHIGGMGKLVGSRVEVMENWIKCSNHSNEEGTNMLGQNWYGTNPVLGTCSGGLHPGIIGRLINLLGKDIVIQAGGGIHGHPGGTRAGAKALRDAVDACVGGISVRDYSRDKPELAAALKKWGDKTPE